MTAKIHLDNATKPHPQWYGSDKEEAKVIVANLRGKFDAAEIAQAIAESTNKSSLMDAIRAQFECGQKWAN